MSSNGNGNGDRGRSAALDVLLTDAAMGNPAARAVRSPLDALGATAKVVRRPDKVARRAAGLAAELAKVAAGRSQVEPPKADKRFADDAWQGNPVFRRLMQAYLAVGQTIDGVVDDAELDWRAEQTMRFATRNLHDFAAPTNVPLTNPEVWKETLNQGGGNLTKGLRRAARDITARRLPAQVDTTRFKVGENLATTPGSVVLSTPLFELIQYAPQTDRVRTIPVLFVPPTINKYYILDLAEGRSIVEHLVKQGLQCFMVSWRNPDAEHAGYDFDSYAQAILDARDAVADITGSETVNLAAACSGGLLSAGALAHLADNGELGEVNTFTLMVAALDSARAGTASALTSRELAAAAVAESERKGYLDAKALGNVFAWLRPNDLIWRYVINNYLMGKPPPAFDILYWNQDGVRLTAGLHKDFVDVALDNTLMKPKACAVLESPVDLGAITLDTYCVAGINDHIVPWENAYRGAQALGGDVRFILSTSGHIQALINPPGPKSRSSFRAALNPAMDPSAFVSGVPTTSGSWWPDWSAWLTERSGTTKAARKTLGSKRFAPEARAPGSYVLVS